MGYTTDFSGEFNLDKPLTPEHHAYLKAFNETRRMQRNVSRCSELPDEVRKAAGLPIGPQGAYFVGAPGSFGQDRTADIVDYNRPPEGQPSLWCQWTPSEDAMSIEWDGGEKFYEYTEWIEYLIEHFLKPWGYTVNGIVYWYGEDHDDRGRIVIANNDVTAEEGHIVYGR